MKERHFFAGSNTAKGFYSYFDYIINLEEADHYYILKGGPGVGKSSFMKNFASHMSSAGHSIEYIHCSGDKDSLDAIVVPALKIAFVDGTAPHTIDPKYPGAVDEIINLGYFFDSRQISMHKEEVIRISQAKSMLYKSAYRYLDAARIIQDEIHTIYDSLTDDLLFHDLCEEVKNELFREGKPSKQPGHIRKLFSESYTTDGYISYTDSLCSGAKVWAIIGENINYTAKLLKEIVKEATENGFDTECFYHPLTPEKLQHVFLPQLNLMIRSEERGKEMNKKISLDKTIDLWRLMDTNRLEVQSSDISEKLKLYDSLINLALKKLSEAKKLHGNLEKIYVGNMDFNGVNKYFNTILARYR